MTAQRPSSVPSLPAPSEQSSCLAEPRPRHRNRAHDLDSGQFRRRRGAGHTNQVKSLGRLATQTCLQLPSSSSDSLTFTKPLISGSVSCTLEPQTLQAVHCSLSINVLHPDLESHPLHSGLRAPISLPAPGRCCRKGHRGYHLMVQSSNPGADPLNSLVFWG